ncbi:MAG: transposase, partial [Clostridia bacterium]|nr:transposase [Clostridia bacterium]
MKAATKYEVIYCHSTKYPVSIMCKFFGVSRSGYYDYIKRRELPSCNTELAELIEECQKNCGKTYGYRRVQIWLERKKSLHFNAKTILHIMNKYG